MEQLIKMDIMTINNMIKINNSFFLCANRLTVNSFLSVLFLLICSLTIALTAQPLCENFLVAIKQSFTVFIHH